MTDLGKCRACPAQMIWANMLNVDGTPSLNAKNVQARNPLDVAELDMAMVTAATHAVAFSPGSGNGMMVTAETIEDVRRWVAKGQVTVHLSHFATCPERGRFKR